MMTILLLSPCHQALAAPLKKPLSFQHFTQKDGLTSEMVYAVAVKGDEVWFGTYAGGTNLYHKSKRPGRLTQRKVNLRPRRTTGIAFNGRIT
jgi:hypothetical protein